MTWRSVTMACRTAIMTWRSVSQGQGQATKPSQALTGDRFARKKHSLAMTMLSFETEKRQRF
jgi:hypothetical protein